MWSKTSIIVWKVSCLQIYGEILIILLNSITFKNEDRYWKVSRGTVRWRDCLQATWDSQWRSQQLTLLTLIISSVKQNIKCHFKSYVLSNLWRDSNYFAKLNYLQNWRQILKGIVRCSEVVRLTTALHGILNGEVNN